MIGLVIDPDGISRTVELPRDPADRAAMIATLTGTNPGGQAVRVAIERGLEPVGGHRAGMAAGQRAGLGAGG
ncbi:hypothetical protein [Herbidospora mongoliensis]|uniref:hypothetical protein n=1 Tax=Herbidospora mongoliensis TaxID=688067 RepID=UPI0008307F72|nr:hypothetical protein [Herbidospora mongoliensis]